MESVQQTPSQPDIMFRVCPWSLRAFVIKVIKYFESVKLSLYNYIEVLTQYFFLMTLMTIFKLVLHVSHCHTVSYVVSPSAVPFTNPNP